MKTWDLVVILDFYAGRLSKLDVTTAVTSRTLLQIRVFAGINGCNSAAKISRTISQSQPKSSTDLSSENIFLSTHIWTDINLIPSQVWER
jgi:hypothetical protein